jgi:sugar lactone lactonase YvrE
MELLKKTPEIKTQATGLGFGESPRWHNNRLWFSNWVVQDVVAMDPDGKMEVITKMPSFPFSIDWLPDGRLVIISGRERLLMLMEPNGSLVTHADLTALSGGCNEIVVDGRGNIYVNGSGLNPAPGEQFAPGIIALITPDGLVKQVAEGIAFPNGMAITPDNLTLIIAESYGKKLTAFDIETDGSLSNRRIWANLGDGTPDGICIDAEGAVWYADVPNKRCVRVLEGGEVLQTVNVDRGCFACMLGGKNRKTLYILAAEWRGFEKMTDDSRTGRVLSIEVAVQGAGWPY